MYAPYCRECNADIQLKHAPLEVLSVFSSETRFVVYISANAKRLHIVSKKERQQFVQFYTPAHTHIMKSKLTPPPLIIHLQNTDVNTLVSFPLYLIITHLDIVNHLTCKIVLLYAQNTHKVILKNVAHSKVLLHTD